MASQLPFLSSGYHISLTEAVRRLETNHQASLKRVNKPPTKFKTTNHQYTMFGLLLLALAAFATLPATLGLVAPPPGLAPGLASGLASSGLAVDVLNNTTMTTTLWVSFSVLSVSSFGSPAPLARTSAAQTSLLVPPVTMPVFGPTTTTTTPWTTAAAGSSSSSSSSPLPPVETLQQTVTLLAIPVPIPPIVINLTDNATKITLTVTSTTLSTATFSLAPPGPPPPSSPAGASGSAPPPPAPGSKSLSKGAIIATVFACVLACWFLFCAAVLLRLRQEQRQKDRKARRSTPDGSPEGLDSVTNHHQHHDVTFDDFDAQFDHIMQTVSASASPPSPVLHSTPADAPTPTPLPGVRLRPHAETDVRGSPITPIRDMPAPGLFQNTPTPAPAPVAPPSSVATSSSTSTSTSPFPDLPPASPVAAAAPPAQAGPVSLYSPGGIQLWGQGVNFAPVQDDYRSDLSFVSRAVSRRHSI
ncbi:hypothetical protein LTR20_006137 [Exophiala xenobiotica]|nr:hypothetical protein LTS13_002894 [Exophiala xenobiotica]KAK5395889.1 hypothetical protein LTR79_006643 [Exophiala xenobiotica]KAK5406779.1 hypothetical protein LTR06_008273 [Exophiala xenobiotica]KAK5423843.1 hypothetical protein LTR90_001189 [Exophiala xenobiotica]KAK5462188.1 hypothetical protein LTR20_006137 [Exophiala xenobiotica]